jgi:hypothetical protein
VTVPFVVRVEKGTLDRSIYEIAVLYDPAQPWTAVAPQRAWNRKLHVPFGGSCAPRHRQDPNDSVMDDVALGRGFAVATSGLNTLGQNCNTVVSAEALMMLKEHLADTYGDIRYTIGEGCSGGAIQQQNIASTYPGLLDGLLPACSFPDIWTTAIEVGDCKLLQHYFDTVSPHLWASAQQRAAVYGYQTGTSCPAWINVFGFDQSGDPSNNDNTFTTCGLSDEQVYDRETNPRGVRCAIQDYQVAIWGRRAQDGFAKRPLDNHGVQYGLGALESGAITAEQFVDMNEKVGGADIDQEFVPERVSADEGAVEIAYRSGQVTHGRELARVPIIDLRGSSNNEVHTDYHSYALRERLRRDNGTAANQVIWSSNEPLVGDPEKVAEAFLLMDRWLAAVEADRAAGTLPEKVLRNRPATAVDACWIGGRRVTDQATCRAAVPYYSAPRIVAGGPLSNDVMKCRLEPPDRADYSATFSDAQWDRLRKAFPDGVCDWRRPSVDHSPGLAWPSFAPGPGGRSLGPTPRSAPLGALGLPSARRCASRRAFRIRLRMPRGERLRSARLYVNGRRVRTLRGRRRTIPVSLRGLPKGTVRVKVVARTRSGRRLVRERRYRTCVARKRRS